MSPAIIQNQSLAKLYNTLPKKAGEKIKTEALYGIAQSFLIAKILAKKEKFILVITKDIATANRIQQEIEFFVPENQKQQVLNFPDWETLPYDHFSPHEDLISERLLNLYRLPKLKNGLLVTSITTLLTFLPPRSYLEKNSLVLKNGETLNLADFRHNLEKQGYRCVNQVMEHGEFAIRGSLLDIFPTGSADPFRIDFFDDCIDSIRTFDPETQLTKNKTSAITLLPAKEYPLTKEAISNFRQNWREFFSGDPSNCPIYENISRGEESPGIEYYLKLFFNKLDTIFDYLPENNLVITIDDIKTKAENFWLEIKKRYEELRHNRERPILPPTEIILTVDKLFSNINNHPQIQIKNAEKNPIPDLTIDHKKEDPFLKLKNFIKATNQTTRCIFSAESLGRRESLIKILRELNYEPKIYESWSALISDNTSLGIIISPSELGGYLEIAAKPDTSNNIFLITENMLFGIPFTPRTIKKRPEQNFENIVKNLSELHVGDPVVHIEHGVGRYLGLQKIKTESLQNANDNLEASEFLTIEYAEKTKLYVPVTSLHLISRYSGSDAEHAPLNSLGSKQWEKTKKETIKKVRDVACELLSIYAKRAAKPGFNYAPPDQNYEKFVSSFPFVETEDQSKAISATIADMTSGRHMDRLICGDVGFGKTEVAIRAAFLAVASNKQVMMLSPTTLLTEQHFNNFKDRFTSWPIKIEMLSRFRSAKETKQILEDLANGKIDIIIGTHKLLQPNIIFKNLGLLIIDEEHRFGVKQKEQIKKLRPDIDILTLTATPIPRTLNMAFSGIRDFSIIATPPPGRLAIKTFVQENNDYVIREAVLREIMRGGQVYFLHNEVASIEKAAAKLEKIVPEARIGIAHGQMHERTLEKIMTDFYKQRFNVLVCSTIIESGIDIPTANTIIINRADRFGLAQLHQLRGRVGRSHHQAYAYLLTPPYKLITKDAQKRLDAIFEMEDLGVGFVLATHDLEIRGAGELLGEEQSGQISAVGFDLYLDYLERAVHALKQGENVEKSLTEKDDITEVDLKIPTIIPENYVADINARLILYKRIANSENQTELDNLQIEMIDRFGLLPESAKNLIHATELKLTAKKLGIRKIIANLKTGSIEFNPKPNINSKKIISLIQKETHIYKLKAGNRLEFNLAHKTANELIDFLKKLLQKIKN